MAQFERATVKNKEGIVCYYDKTTKKTALPGEMTPEMITSTLVRLAKYEEVQEKGRLRVMPCGIGDKVYLRHVFRSELCDTDSIVAVEASVSSITVCADGKVKIAVNVEGSKAQLLVGNGEFFESKELALATPSADKNDKA